MLLKMKACSDRLTELRVDDQAAVVMVPCVGRSQYMGLAHHGNTVDEMHRARKKFRGVNILSPSILPTSSSLPPWLHRDLVISRSLML